MKIMVFGAGGFVASYLIKECLKNGDEVIGTIRWNEDLLRTEEFKDKIKLEYVEGTDLSAMIRVINKHRPDCLSFLMAQSWVPYSMDNPIYTMKNNIESTLNIMEAIRIIRDVDERTSLTVYNKNESERMIIENNYRPLVHIVSSSEVYGKVERKDLPITENHKANPGNVYGVSKTAGDFLAQIYEKYYDLRILITRMFTHTGAGRTMPSAENYYAKEVALREIDNGNIISVSDEQGMKSIRTWADVRDAVKNYYNLYKTQKTGIYNISGQTTKSIQEVLDYLVSISNIKNKDKLKYIPDPKFFRKIDVDKQIADISKFKQDCEWSNEISFEELMQSLLDYWRKKIK